MSWSMDCVKYWIYLKEKGWFDESFYTEYDFVCREVYNHFNSKYQTSSDSLQTTTLLHREKLT